MEISIKIKRLMPDRSNYKKYGVEYEPESLYLSLNISEKEVVQEGNSYFVTEAGLKQIVSRLADIVDEIETEHLKQIQKKQG